MPIQFHGKNVIWYKHIIDSIIFFLSKIALELLLEFGLYELHMRWRFLEGVHNVTEIPDYASSISEAFWKEQNYASNIQALNTDSHDHIVTRPTNTLPMRCRRCYLNLCEKEVRQHLEKCLPPASLCCCSKIRYVCPPTNISVPDFIYPKFRKYKFCLQSKSSDIIFLHWQFFVANVAHMRCCLTQILIQLLHLICEAWWNARVASSQLNVITTAW